MPLGACADRGGRLLPSGRVVKETRAWLQQGQHSGRSFRSGAAVRSGRGAEAPGELSGAIDALRKAYQLSGQKPGTKAFATARTERDYENAEAAVARLRLGGLETLAKERYVSPLDFARLHSRVGEGAALVRSVGIP